MDFTGYINPHLLLYAGFVTMIIFLRGAIFLEIKFLKLFIIKQSTTEIFDI